MFEISSDSLYCFPLKLWSSGSSMMCACCIGKGVDFIPSTAPVQVKELSLLHGIGAHDLTTKVKQIEIWLEKKNHVRVTLRTRRGQATVNLVRTLAFWECFISGINQWNQKLTVRLVWIMKVKWVSSVTALLHWPPSSHSSWEQQADMCFLSLSSIRKQLWKRWCNRWEWWLALFPSRKQSVMAKQPCASWDLPRQRNCHKKERATRRICSLLTPNPARTKLWTIQRQQKSPRKSDFRKKNVHTNSDGNCVRRWRIFLVQVWWWWRWCLSVMWPEQCDDRWQIQFRSVPSGWEHEMHWN